jgi:hypothetical protein
MLQWVNDSDGWRSNGFLIRQGGPSRWLLLETAIVDESCLVNVIPEPLTVTTTLSNAKREAELLATSRQSADQRRSSVLQLLASGAGVVMVLGFGEPWNMFLSFALTGTALHAAAKLLSSWIDHWAGDPGDLFYQ